MGVSTGEVSEWLKEHAWKVCILERVSRVRIPPSPQDRNDVPAKGGAFCLEQMGRVYSDQMRENKMEVSEANGHRFGLKPLPYGISGANPALSATLIFKML
jgi:hypothetical protein